MSHPDLSRHVAWCSAPVAALAGPSLLSAVTTMGWSVGEALLVPFLMQHGISADIASLVWIINPILGLFVNAGAGRAHWALHTISATHSVPFAGCGLLMDRCISLLAFVYALELFSILGLGLVAVSDLIADSPQVLLVLVLLGYGAADLAHDMLAAPTRSIVLQKAAAQDVSPLQKAPLDDKANAMISMFLDGGRLLGLLLVSLPWRDALPDYGKGVSHLQACIIVVTIVNIVFVCAAVWTSGQVCSCRTRRATAKESCCQAVVADCAPLGSLPFAAKWVLLMTLLGWLLLNMLSFYWTAWVSGTVLQATDRGETDRATAMQWGAGGMAVSAAVSMLWGLVLPYANRSVGELRMFVFGVLVGCFVCLATAVHGMQTLAMSMVLSALAGILPAVLSINAYSLLQRSLAEHPLGDQLATMAGLINTCMVASQLLGACGGVFILGIARNKLKIPCTWYLSGPWRFEHMPSNNGCDGHTSVAFLLAVYGVLVLLVIAAMLTRRPSQHFSVRRKAPVLPPTVHWHDESMNGVSHLRESLLPDLLSPASDSDSEFSEARSINGGSHTPYV